ncbi:PAS domain S-box protein [Paracoccus caeni]|uniref:histidine kinase n=2 Tax=Paracoccus caeni TaxID=657651 RepID=A0A934SDC5_9RHOB|nr:PAS domain S-box protein [Paracoccus caeni]
MINSLSALMALGFAGLQFLAILVVVFSSYVTSERALIQHARDLLRDVGVNTIEHSKGFLNPAQGAAELAARLAQNEVITGDDTRQLESLLFQQLQIAPQFAGLYFGRSDGGFVYVMRSPNGPGAFRTKVITYEDGVRNTQLIWRNKDFTAVAQQMDPLDRFDPRDRPWYREASAELTTIWTDPYIFFSSQQPGITLAAPVTNPDGSVRGVVGVDIEISMISEFLSRLNIGMHGKALIINHNGDVIAHPDQSLLKTIQDDGTLRFSDIRELGDPIARAAFGPLALAGGIPVAVETPTQFVYEKEPYVAAIMPVIDKRLPWTIAVYAPEEDFTGVLKRNRALNIWLAALIAIITGVIGLVLAEIMSRPVRAFAVRAALISQGELDPGAKVPKTYRELERANTTLMEEIAARRTAERQYGETFDMASRGMAQIAASGGEFIRVNSRLSQILGYSEQELLQLRLADLIHPDERMFLLLAENPVTADFDVNSELRCLRKDGAVIWVRINTILIRDGQGTPLHAVLTLDDITQVKQSAAQIEQLEKDLSHLNRGNTMGEMATGLAHELNQPLAAIAQNADTARLVLNQQPSPEPELQVILGEIESQALRAGDIIRALRSFIDKDKGTRTGFDFQTLLQQALHLVRAEATDADVTILTEGVDQLPPVLGNRVQIAQVIVNLLRNAIEAIDLGDAPENPRRITVRGALVNDNVRISVEDTGPGVPPGLDLFTKFETTKSNGMGLGLSICRSIIEANGGKIWHEDRQGGGSVFAFNLPVHQLA